MFQAKHIFLFLCLVSSQAAATEETTSAASVILGDVGTNVCPEDYEKISDYRMCVAAMDILGPGNLDLNPAAFPAEDFTESEFDENYPSGCYAFDYEEYEGLVAFNRHPAGREVPGMTPICGSNLEPPKSGETLYVGDSDVDYWISRPSSFFDYNVAVGGYTCEDVVENVETYLDYFKPKTVVLVCGENDLASGASVSTASDRLSSAVKIINEKGAAVIFMGTKNEPNTTSLWDEYAQYDDYARSLAKTKCGTNVAGRPEFTFIDVNTAFEDVGNPDSFYAPDQLHLSDEAYALWSEWVGAALNESACCSWRGNECVQNHTPGPTSGPASGPTSGPTSDASKSSSGPTSGPISGPTSGPRSDASKSSYNWIYFLLPIAALFYAH